MPGEGERWWLCRRCGQAINKQPAGALAWSHTLGGNAHEPDPMPVVPASRLEAAESERDGMKILAGRAADDVARFASALTEALDALDKIGNAKYRQGGIARETAARLRSRIEGSNDAR